MLDSAGPKVCLLFFLNIILKKKQLLIYAVVSFMISELCILFATLAKTLHVFNNMTSAKLLSLLIIGILQLHVVSG